jgi:hypothetical protein
MKINYCKSVCGHGCKKSNEFSQQDIQGSEIKEETEKIKIFGDKKEDFKGKQQQNHYLTHRVQRKDGM